MLAADEETKTIGKWLDTCQFLDCTLLRLGVGQFSTCPKRASPSSAFLDFPSKAIPRIPESASRNGPIAGDEHSYSRNRARNWEWPPLSISGEPGKHKNVGHSRRRNEPRDWPPGAFSLHAPRCFSFPLSAQREAESFVANCAVNKMPHRVSSPLPALSFPHRPNCRHPPCLRPLCTSRLPAHLLGGMLRCSSLQPPHAGRRTRHS